jgi:drug/metabolite transporter (DMT)-like permease
MFYVLIGAVTFLWGLSFPSIKVGLGLIEPFTFIWIRSLISATLIFSIIAYRGTPWKPPRGRPAFWVNTILHNLLFVFVYPGAALTTSGRTSVFVYTQPLIYTALAAYFIPVERLGPRSILGFAAAFGGIVVLFGEKLTGGGNYSFLGDGLVLIGAFCWGVQSIYLRINLQGIDPFRITAWTQLVAIPMFLILASIQGIHIPDFTNPLVSMNVAYNGLVGTGIVMVLWVRLLANYPPSRVSAFMFLCPVFGVFLSGLILAEPLTAFMLGGAALVAAGIFLVNTDKRRGS